MPGAPRPPSALGIWLEEQLRSWILPVAALAVVAAVGLLYFLGLLSEPVTGAAICVAAPVAAGALSVRAALAPGGNAVGRGLGVAAAVAAALLAAGPSLGAVLPGEPLFSGELAAGASLPVPAGASGRVRVLVSGHLRQAGEPEVRFHISGTDPAIEGKLERSWRTARVGRGGRARVAHDHLADWFEVRIPEGSRELKLERVQGQPSGPLTVRVDRQRIPAGVLLGLAALTLLSAAVADARIGSKGEVLVPVGMALAFALLVVQNATPAEAVGPALGGVLLGGMSGALAAAVLGLVVRRLVPPAQRRARKPSRP